MTDTGSEFQRDGAAHQKERFAKLVRANGWMSSGVAYQHSVHAMTLMLMSYAIVVYISSMYSLYVVLFVLTQVLQVVCSENSRISINITVASSLKNG